MNFKKYLPFVAVIIFLIVLGFFLTGYNNSLKKTGENNIKYVKLENKSIQFVKIARQMIKVDLALTETQQEQGLSGRKSLADDAGMLFIFPQPSKYFFWMKDMNFPIDMIWFDENFKVIYIKKDALPSSYPKSFGPNVDNRYVLEVSANFSEKNNLKVGDKVEFLP